MKILNHKEIIQLSEAILMTVQEAREVADIFVQIFTKEQHGGTGWKIKTQLNSVEDYIEEWENHWHRELSWEEFYKYEKNNCFSDYTNAEKIFKTLESFKNYIQSFEPVYELQCNNMILVVC